jgi:hypothetical protein
MLTAEDGVLLRIDDSWDDAAGRRALEELHREICEHDIYSRVVLVALEPAMAPDAKMAVVASWADFQVEPPRETTREESRAILVGMLERSMAHGSQHMGTTHARELADQLFARFCSGDCTYFTNGEFPLRHAAGQSGGSWCGLTDSTFDSGIVVIGPTFGLAIWFEDED